MRRTPKSLSAYDAEVHGATASFYDPAVPTIAEHCVRCPCYLTSTNADIALVTWWPLYWLNEPPTMVRPSTGHTYKVSVQGRNFRVRILDHQNHRRGVEAITT